MHIIGILSSTSARFPPFGLAILLLDIHRPPPWAALSSLQPPLGVPCPRTDFPTSLNTAAFTRCPSHVILRSQAFNAARARLRKSTYGHLFGLHQVIELGGSIQLSNWMGVSMQFHLLLSSSLPLSLPPFIIWHYCLLIRSTSNVPHRSPFGVLRFHTTPDSPGIFPSAAHLMCFPSLSGASLS